MLVDEAFPEDKVEFLPAGFLAQVPSLKAALGVKKFPFEGAHPNCESVYVMLSDGEKYVPLTHYLKTTPSEALRDLMEADKRLGERMARFEKGAFGGLMEKLGLKSAWLKWMGARMATGFGFGHVHLSRLIRGSGPAKIWHALALAVGLPLAKKARTVLEKHTNVHGDLEIIVLPFEDPYNLESDRMERCPSAFGFVNPETGEADSMPMCAWLQIYKNPIMEKIAANYGSVKHDAEAKAEEAPMEPVGGE